VPTSASLGRADQITCGAHAMNYRHAFHAGNFADVVKHITLVACLDHLKQKPKPFRVLDTHAGAGIYRLDGGDADRTGEWRQGIARLLDADPPPHLAPLIDRYLGLVRAEQADAELRRYPGSPRLIQASLRPTDVFIATETEPAVRAALDRALGNDRRVKILDLDGYTALKAVLPPPEARGLVLVDPPFEAANEFHRMTDGLAQALTRFRTGLMLLWYPIKDAKPIERFHRHVRDLATAYRIETILALDVLLRPARHPDRLAGCGLVVVNAPLTLQQVAVPLVAWLARILSDANGAAGTVTQLGAPPTTRAGR
jgi:23S rRNA (adenine2030-N6)-methyltransferase